jgi:membrane protein required for colicin V production
VTWVDYFIIIVVGLGAFSGYKSGLFKKVFAFVGLVVGLVAATKAMGPLGRVLSNSVGFQIEVSYVFAFGSVFLAVMILQNIIARKLGDLGGGIEIVNKVGGAVVGVMQSSLIASIILLMLSIFSIPSPASAERSPLHKTFLHLAPRLFDLTSRFLPETKSFYDELREDLSKYEFKLR